MQLCGEAADMVRLKCLQTDRRLADQPHEYFEIAPIVADRMRRQAALLRQFAEVEVDHQAMRSTRASAAEAISPKRSR